MSGVNSATQGNGPALKKTVAAPEPQPRGHQWNPKDRFQTNPFTAINMTEKNVRSTNVGLRDFFRNNDIPHNAKVFRGTMQPANLNTAPKAGNVSLYSYDWKDGKSVMAANDKATVDDLLKAVQEGHLTQNDFAVQFQVHHGEAASVESFHLKASTFHDYAGRVVATADSFPRVENGNFWARMRQAFTEAGAKLAEKPHL